MNFSIFYMSLIQVILKAVHCKYVEGNLITAERWTFVSRFCFLSEDGIFEYAVEYNEEYAVQNILLYYDSEYQWPSVYKTSKTCREKESVLNLDQNQIINLTDFEPATGCIRVSRPKSSVVKPFGNKTAIVNGQKSVIISCHNIRRFQSARPRWWFLAVSNCNSTDGLNMRYKFLMTNGPTGNLWREHFSADEFYILPLLSTFFVIYLVLILVAFICSIELKSRQLLHSTYKLFNLSIVLQEVGITLLIIAYVKYGLDGVGYPTLKTIGRMFESMSEIIFLLLMLLLAKGYTVTRGRLKLSSSIKLTVFMCSYTVTTAALFFYEGMLFDPGEVLYLYESPAGYGLLILRLLAWCMFMYSTVFTLKHYPEKSNFYYPFNLMGTIWFIIGPCFTLTANNFIDKWIRESMVYGIQHFIAITGHTLFLLITLPNRANKNFPYHVRTSQIGVIDYNNGEIGFTSNSYRFNQHMYAPYSQSSASSVGSNATTVESLPDTPVSLFRSSQSTGYQNKGPMIISTSAEYPLDCTCIQTEMNEIIKQEQIADVRPTTQNNNDDNKTTPDDQTSEEVLDHFLAPSVRNN